MARTGKASRRLVQLANRLHARLAARGRVSSGFVGQPEPRTIGSLVRGRQLADGHFLFAGHMVDASDGLWDIAAPDLDFEDERQGFVWLDDLAALGDHQARGRARAWTADWIERYGPGRGPGWRPGLTGRRISRWISHAVMLTEEGGEAFEAPFLRSLSRQTHFLARRHQGAMPGLPRFEALGGLIHASLLLSGMRRHLDVAIQALAVACREDIDSGGGLPTRNPQELLEVFSILTWTAAALSDAGRIAPRDHLAAIERVAPVLRALRHADGNLARFHGGGRGAEGRLDQSLAASGVRTIASGQLAMGFARLSGGRTSVIIDAAPPPKGPESMNAHASTLAFELTTGRRPLIVSCGSGAIFGKSWHRAGRATPSHSTLGIEGASSSKLGKKVWVGGHAREFLVEVPGEVTARFEDADDETAISLRHDGFAKSHGLHHSRYLRLSSDGRRLIGEDELAVLSKGARRKFDARRAAQAGGGSFGFAVRFHLHPDVTPGIVDHGVELHLKSGEVWRFEMRGPVHLAVEPSLYLEHDRLEPRATKQIVLSGSMIEYATQVSWRLAKSDDTPNSLRDLDWGRPSGAARTD